MNLVLNDAAASPVGGRIAVDASLTGAALAVAITDSGPGLPPFAERILLDECVAAPLGEPWGLGLWMVRRVVSECGGAIDCGPSSLGGASITLTLPILRHFDARVTTDEAA